MTTIHLILVIFGGLISEHPSGGTDTIAAPRSPFIGNEEPNCDDKSRKSSTICAQNAIENEYQVQFYQ